MSSNARIHIGALKHLPAATAARKGIKGDSVARATKEHYRRNRDEPNFVDQVGWSISNKRIKRLPSALCNWIPVQPSSRCRIVECGSRYGGQKTEKHDECDRFHGDLFFRT